MSPTSKSNLKVKIQGFKYKSYFKVFPLQQHAFDFIDKKLAEERKHNEEECSSSDEAEDRVEVDEKTCVDGSGGQLLFSLEPRLFAFEYNDQGKRRYVVSHLGRFMQEYWMEMKPNDRNYYELIREETPCRLYFDLEYNKKANPNITESENETLLNEFIDELSLELKTVFDISIHRNNIIDLDSSTDKKFSRHFIIHMPNGELFADAPACGIFVKNFVGRLAEEVATGEMAKKHTTLAKYLFVHNKSPNEEHNGNDKENISNNTVPKVCFVDTGVYTRNRVFRILGSVKYGKSPSAALRIASGNQYPFPKRFKNEFFYNSTGTSSEYEDDVQHESFWETHALALNDTLVVPFRSEIDRSQILPEIKAKDDVLNVESIAKLKKNTLSKGRSRKANFGPSPFPQLDDFVNNTLAMRHGLNGSIRSWNLDNNQITYFMKDNRWCENIQRSHKSNNIIWNISLADGIYWQSCLDQECKFRGVQKDLPSHIKLSLSDYLLDQNVNVDEEFERVLLEIKLDAVEKNDNDDNVKEASTFEVDDEFNKALMNLTISNSKKSGHDIKDCDNDNGNNDMQSLCDNEENQSRRHVDESFDKEFEAALLKELTKNPSSFG